MNPIILFAIEVSLSLMVSTVVLLVISPPLMRALEELSPTPKQAAFRLSYTRAMLMLSPLLLVLLMNLLIGHDNPLSNIQVTLISALSGVLLGLIFIGKRVFLTAYRRNTAEHHTAGEG